MGCYRLTIHSRKRFKTISSKVLHCSVSYFQKSPMKAITLTAVSLIFLCVQCKHKKPDTIENKEVISEAEKGLNDEPIITDLFTADPSAHVFEGKLYLYPSHDYESGIHNNAAGNHFDMRDYHVYSTDKIGGEVTDHGVALDIKDVPWAKRQMWAPDAAERDGTYYLYFPAKDAEDIFHIGVASSSRPEGPFKAEASFIEGSYSIDPSVFEDQETHYMYFGGIWGGQMQWYQNNKFKGKEDNYPSDNEPAISPKIVKMSDDMLSFAESPKDVLIVDRDGNPLLQADTERRFYEGAWVHKYNGKYYLSYSTGDTHKIVYAIADSPYGPFTYQGVVLNEVLGWTNHHSIVEFEGKWHLFYHDSSLSGGQTHLRSVKVTELIYNEDGTIIPLNKMVKE